VADGGAQPSRADDTTGAVTSPGGSALAIRPVVRPVGYSRLPSASVKYVFAVFVGLVLLSALAVPLRR
jgi:hypothetical protein